MRGYVVRVMQLGKESVLPREIEIITPKERLVDLILQLGSSSERPQYWDVFYVEGDVKLFPDEEVELSSNHVAVGNTVVSIKYILMSGSLVLTENGYALYQNFGEPKDIMI